MFPKQSWSHLGQTQFTTGRMADQPIQRLLSCSPFWKRKSLNEAASMMFIPEHTNIPVPKLHCCFEDDEAVYLIMQYAEGVGMNELAEEKRKVIEEELEVHSAVMKKLKSKIWGGPSRIVCPLCG